MTDNRFRPTRQAAKTKPRVHGWSQNPRQTRDLRGTKPPEWAKLAARELFSPGPRRTR